MGTDVLAAPKLYLDTCHLIRIAKLRKGVLNACADIVAAYELLDECIQKRHFGLIFNPAAPLEWVDGAATIQTANEIAAVVDSAALQYELEQDGFVYLCEVLNELRRTHADLKLPCYPILPVRLLGGGSERAVSVLMEEVPELFDDLDLLPGARDLPRVLPFYSVRDCVDRAWDFKHRRRTVYDERVEGFKDSLLRDIDTFTQRSGKSITKRDHIEWMKRFLKVDVIVNKLNPTSDSDIDDLLAGVDLDRCPAVNLFMKAREKRIRAGCNPNERESKPNDADDWMYVPVVPYADLVLSERGLGHYLKQADPSPEDCVTHDVRRAVQILGRWL